MTRLGINGLGRVGRLLVRCLQDRPDARAQLSLSACNELADNVTIAHLIKYDSTFGRYAEPVELDGEMLRVADQSFRLFHYDDPADIPWADRGVDLVVDCSGTINDRGLAARHLSGNVQRVLLSQPATPDVDATVIVGVNEADLTSDMEVVSAGSCTSNALIPVIKVLDDAFGVDAGVVTTIHSAMNDQPVIDAYHHTDLRKTRSAFSSVIPVDTELAAGVDRLLPHLSGRFSARAMRVPTVNVSALDLSVVVESDIDIDRVNQVLMAAQQSMAPIFDVSAEPLASCDFLRHTASCVVDLTQTQISGRRLLKLLIWFDNEWAFVNRMIDIALRMAEFTQGSNNRLAT